MSDSAVGLFAQDQIVSLLQKLEDNQLDRDFESSLRLFDDLEEQQYFETPREPRDNLLWSINNLKYFPHKKGTQYKIEYEGEIKSLLDEFPDDRVRIKKYL